MRRVLIATLGSVAALMATSAMAAPTLVQETGPDLSTKIYASGDAGIATTGTTVYGNTSNGAGHNVEFSGYKSFNTTTLTTGTATDLKITGGNGFAQVADADGVNPTGNNPTPVQNDLFAIIMNPVPDFYLYEFSILQYAAGNVSIYYDLTGGGTNWILATNSPIMNGNGDTQYIFGDANNPALAIDQVLILSSTAIQQIKQNSIQQTGTTPPVPEPATWAMMLLGFGGIGMTMRRKQRRNGALMQVA